MTKRVKQNKLTRSLDINGNGQNFAPTQNFAFWRALKQYTRETLHTAFVDYFKLL